MEYATKQEKTSQRGNKCKFQSQTWISHFEKRHNATKLRIETSHKNFNTKKSIKYPYVKSNKDSG